MTLLLDGLYRTSSKELPKQAQRDDELLSLPLTSCRLHVCLYVGRGRFHQAMLPALGALFSLPIQNAPTTIVSVPVKAGAGYERSLILRTDRTLGTTTPQSPTMSIGLLRLEIMHISRIRQLWLVWQLCRYHSPVPNVWPSRRRQIQLLQLWRCMGGHVRRGRPVHAPRWVPSMQRESRRGKRTRRVQAPAAVHRRRLLCFRRLHNQPS